MNGSADRWEVRPGDIWTVGPHALYCLDFEEQPEVVEQFAARAELVYCDPPWTQALATGYRTKAGVPRPVDYHEFVQLLVSLLKPCQGPVFIEIGVTQKNLVDSVCEHAGGRKLGEWHITYNRGATPCWLLAYAWSDDVKPPDGDATGLDSRFTPYWAIERYDAIDILDPCTGPGTTAMAAEALKRIYTGTDLHPRRIAEVLQKLWKAGAGKPQLAHRA